MRNEPINHRLSEVLLSADGEMSSFCDRLKKDRKNLKHQEISQFISDLETKGQALTIEVNKILNQKSPTIHIGSEVERSLSTNIAYLKNPDIQQYLGVMQKSMLKALEGLEKNLRIVEKEFKVEKVNLDQLQ